MIVTEEGKSHMDIFSNVLFYNYMSCRKSQILRGLDRRFPLYLLFSQVYEESANVYDQIMVNGKNGWGYPWDIHINHPLLGIKEEVRSYSDFLSAKSDILEIMNDGREVYIWTRNRYISHMEVNQADPQGIHSLTLMEYSDNKFTIMDYPFQREYETEVLEQAFNDVPEDKRIVTTYQMTTFDISKETKHEINREFQQRILNSNDDFSMYDRLIHELELKGVNKFIQQSMHVFGVISLSRLLTSIFMEDNGYSEGAVYAAQQAAKAAESMKNNFLKLNMKPSRLKADEISEKFEQIKQIDRSFLQLIQHEIKTGERKNIEAKPLAMPEKLKILQTTDSSAWISWEDSQSEREAIEYEIRLNDVLLDCCISRDYIVGNLQESTAYTIGVRAKNRFGNYSQEAKLNMVTESLSRYGILSNFKPVFVSSAENEDLIGRRIVDNNSDTRWSSEYSDQQWAYVDLGSTKDITRIRLHWEGAYAKEYEIMLSKDLENWKLIEKVNDGQPGIFELKQLTEKARYVKINCLKRANIYGYSLWELSVFNDEPAAIPS